MNRKGAAKCESCGGGLLGEKHEPWCMEDEMPSHKGAAKHEPTKGTGVHRRGAKAEVRRDDQQQQAQRLDQAEKFDQAAHNRTSNE